MWSGKAFIIGNFPFDPFSIAPQLFLPSLPALPPHSFHGREYKNPFEWSENFSWSEQTFFPSFVLVALASPFWFAVFIFFDSEVYLFHFAIGWGARRETVFPFTFILGPKNSPPGLIRVYLYLRNIMIVQSRRRRTTEKKNLRIKQLSPPVWWLVWGTKNFFHPQ